MILRFFAEEGVNVCVWGDEEDADETQYRLPIPADLSADMDAWILEYNQRVQENKPEPCTAQWAEDHDRRGYQLSRRLQNALGAEHDVHYRFGTSVVRAELASTDGPASTVPQPARLSEVVRAVAVLALPGGDQLAWATARGGPMSPDALAIDLFDMVDQIPAFHHAGWIGSLAAERIVALARAVEDISRPERASLWTATALREASEWENVRELARVDGT